MDGILRLLAEEDGVNIVNKSSLQELECPPSTQLPSFQEFRQGLGDWAIVLYCSAGTVTAVLGVLLCILLRQFILSVETSKVVHTLWVTSVFFMLSVFNLASILLPRASDFIILAYRIYLAIAMGHFVDLTMKWYGGESAMLEHIDKSAEELEGGNKINFRGKPCCCCLCLPGSATLSKNKLRFMKTAVYQVPYSQSVCLFILGSLQISGFVELGKLSFNDPYVYITFFLTVSFMSGLWGLFMFFNITAQFDLLHNYNYRKKSLSMKLVIVLVNIQSTIINILVGQFNVVGCIPGYISEAGVGLLIQAICMLFESLLMGVVNFIIYKDEGTYL